MKIIIVRKVVRNNLVYLPLVYTSYFLLLHHLSLTIVIAVRGFLLFPPFSSPPPPPTLYSFVLFLFACFYCAFWFTV